MNTKNGHYRWRIQVVAVKEAAEDGKKPATIAASRKVEPPVIRFVTGTVQLLEQEGDTRSG
jgi:hypothetical protein